MKNTASVRDFTQTQTTEEAAVRDGGGSPHQQFSPHPPLSSQKLPLVQGNSLGLFAASSTHKKGREAPESAQGWETFLHDRSRGRREGAGPALWQPQATGTFKCLVQLPLSPAWWHLAGLREQAPEGLHASCILSNTPPEIGYEVIKIKFAQVI